MCFSSPDSNLHFGQGCTGVAGPVKQQRHNGMHRSMGLKVAAVSSAQLVVNSISLLVTHCKGGIRYADEILFGFSK